ncbi:AFG1/ZapE family ATPase, partial [Pelagibacteraceae bacterium]|nr:AFG1/ZapE family ATPase [Pelagibacteraceae bacterium]
ENYFSGIARIKFNDLCNVNIGAEDYVNIAATCKHVFIEEIPKFQDENSNQQMRFITLIDIFYEKNISLSLSLESDFKSLGSSKKHSEIFKRTLSRLIEMTNPFY